MILGPLASGSPCPTVLLADKFGELCKLGGRKSLLLLLLLLLLCTKVLEGLLLLEVLLWLKVLEILLLRLLLLLLLEILEPLLLLLLLHWPSPPCIWVHLHLVDTDAPSLLVARLLRPHPHPLP